MGIWNLGLKFIVSDHAQRVRKTGFLWVQFNSIFQNTSEQRNLKENNFGNTAIIRGFLLT